MILIDVVTENNDSIALYDSTIVPRVKELIEKGEDTYEVTQVSYIITRYDGVDYSNKVKVIVKDITN